MRAAVYRRYGIPADVLELDHVAEPTPPGPGEVTVRVLSRPIHHGDLLGVAGRYGTGALPERGARIGFEGAGVVDAVGEGVPLPVGARVAFFPGRGAWSERVTLPVAFVTAVPDAISDDLAAQLHVNPLTAILLARAAVAAGAGPGSTVVLTAAGSAVAKLAAVLLVEAGASVIGLVRSSGGAEALGAALPEIAVLATDAAGWQDRLAATAGALPIRTVLDAVGGEIASALLARIAGGGSLLSYGDLSGEPITAPALWFSTRNIAIRGVTVGSWGSLPEGQRRQDVATALRLAAAHPELFPIACRYDLGEVAQAAAHVDRAGKAGTVLLTSA